MDWILNTTEWKSQQFHTGYKLMVVFFNPQKKKTPPAVYYIRDISCNRIYWWQVVNLLENLKQHITIVFFQTLR